MKFATKFSLTAFGLLSGLALGSTAGAAETMPSNAGPYVSLGAGITIPESSNARILGPGPGPGFPGTDVPAKFSWGTGYNIVGAVGWKMNSGLRTELEGDWRSTDLHRVNGQNWNGKEKIFGFMGNVLYDFKTNSSITPYVGGGIGVARNRIDNVTGPGSGTTPAPAFSGSDTNFQWQLIAGLSVPIARRVALFADYRYIQLDDNRIHSHSTPFAEINSYDDKSHNILVGVRISFGGPGSEQTRTVAESSPAPMASTPAPIRTAAPAPPPVPEKVLAFFDFDKDGLRPDAMQIVREAADFVKQNNKTQIRVTGYTDTSGTAEYNLALSKRRAMTVKAALIRLGIPENEIGVAWKGESDLLVQTGNGVKEPQNRRVEIIYE